MEKLLITGAFALFNILTTIGTANATNFEFSKNPTYQLELEKYVEEERNNYEKAYVSAQTIGDIHFFKDEYDVAEKYYLKSLEIAKKLEDKEAEALAYMRIARVYRNKGDKEKAKEYYLKAYEIYKDIGDQKGVELVSKILQELDN